jgi:hypothetical protein
MNALIEDAVGVVMGSMWKKERKKSGPDVLRNVGSAFVRKVIGARMGGTMRDGRARREGRRARGVEETGVRMSLHRSLALVLVWRGRGKNKPRPNHINRRQHQSRNPRRTHRNRNTGERIRTIQYTQTSSSC